MGRRRLGTWLAATALLATVAAARAETLDLSTYEVSFQDDFKSPDVVAGGPFSDAAIKARWIAHTPWNGDFSAGSFGNPSELGPFGFGNGGLSITARKDPDGKWVAGLICSVDRDGQGQQGFAQQYGYFEMRAKLPEGPGDWSGFWLVGTKREPRSPEIDVIEFYGHNPSAFVTTLHLWDMKDKSNNWGDLHMVQVDPHSLTERYNDFGVLIGPDRTKFYLNRVQYLDVPTPPEYRQPMYMLANLAIGGGWPYDKLTSPQVMNIEYIRAYREKGRTP